MINLGLEEIGKEISSNNKNIVDDIVEIPLKDILPNEDNFYKISNIDQLKEDMLLNGQIESLIVTPSEQVGEYKIISGHRRYNALLLLEQEGLLDTAKCIIKDYNTKEEESLALIGANEQRIKSKEERNQEIKLRKKYLKKLKEDNPGKYENININKLLAEEFNMSETSIKNITKEQKPLVEEKKIDPFIKSLRKLLKDVDKIVEKYEIPDNKLNEELSEFGDVLSNYLTKEDNF